MIKLVVCVTVANMIHCGTVEIKNLTKVWSRGDTKQVERSYKRCIEKYGTGLVKFHKRGELSYWAICGRNN